MSYARSQPVQQTQQSPVGAHAAPSSASNQHQGQRVGPPPPANVTPRLNELLDGIKQEFMQLSSETSALMMHKDEFDHKLLTQHMNELTQVRKTIYELDTAHRQMKERYEEEILRLKKKLDARNDGSGPSPAPTQGVVTQQRQSQAIPQANQVPQFPIHQAPQLPPQMQPQVPHQQQVEHLQAQGQLPPGENGQHHLQQLQHQQLQPPQLQQPQQPQPQQQQQTQPQQQQQQQQQQAKPGQLRQPQQLLQQPQVNSAVIPQLVSGAKPEEPGTPQNQSSQITQAQNQNQQTPQAHGQSQSQSQSQQHTPQATSQAQTPTQPANSSANPNANQAPPPQAATPSQGQSQNQNQNQNQSQEEIETGLDAESIRIGNDLAFLDVDAVPPQNKKTAQGYTVVYNAKAPPQLDVELVQSLKHSSVVCCVRFSLDGRYLATGCNRCAQIFDVSTGELVCRLQDASVGDDQDLYIRSVCFSPDGKYLATGAEDHQIRVWDIQTLQIKHLFTGHEQDIYSLDFSSSGQFIVSGSGDLSVRVWDVDSGKSVLTLTIEDGVTAVAISPDDRYIAAGSLDRIVRIWEAQTGTLVERLEGPEGHQDSVYSVAFSPNGLDLVSGSLDKSIKIWELQAPRGQPALPNGRCIRTINGHRDYVLSVATTPDSKWILSGSKDRTVQMWDAQTGQAQFMLQAHVNSVISVAPSPTGQLFASGSGDFWAKIWRAIPRA